MKPLEVVQIEETQKRQITLLQENLASIRRIAGWTAEQLGERIGVTKQTVSNLENLKTPMTLTQYIAIRAVLDYEIHTHPDNALLAQVMSMLLDQDEQYSDEERAQIHEKVRTLAAAAAGGIAGASLAALGAGILGGAAGIAGAAAVTGALPIVGGIAGATWLAKILQKSDNKTNRGRKKEWKS